MKIKTGDKVLILSGKDKGKEGKVLQVFPGHERLVVEGLNLMTRHLKGGGGKSGQKIQFSSPMHASNVKLVSKKTGLSGRIGYKFIDKEGKREKIRVIRKKGSVEDVE